MGYRNRGLYQLDTLIDWARRLLTLSAARDSEPPKEQNPLQSNGLAWFVVERLQLSKRRAWDSNPQPVARHLNSNQLQNGENAEEYGNTEQRAAPGAAVSAENAGKHANAAVSTEANRTTPVTGNDADLTEVANRWATLPEAVRLAVMALARSAGG